MGLSRLECADATAATGRQLWHGWLPILLAVGFAVRLGALSYTIDLDARIADEKQYVQLATSLLNGDGFAWASGEQTSLRPPLYPAFLAAIWSVAGAGDLQAIRIVQFLLSLATAALVYALGRRVFGPAVGGLAAAIVWLYPSLVFLNFNILGETLFTFLLLTWVLLTVMLVDRPRMTTAVASGVALGLGALTRSVLWPVPLVLCPLLVAVLTVNVRQRLTLAVLVLAGYAAVVGPWAVRNTRLQGVVTVVDTMGGMNLRMGNYEHTPEDRMWDAVSMSGEKSWVHALVLEQAAAPPAEPYTEGMKDKWAQRKAVEYMIAHPGTTLRRAAIKFADFWGLEREFIAAASQDLYAPPRWFAVAVAALILVSYASLALLSAAGIWLAPPAWRTHLVLLLPVVVIAGVHTIVFGHSRYHLPLVPVLALYAAAVAVAIARGDQPAGRLRRAGAAVSIGLLVAMWARQVIVVDGERLRALVNGL